MHSQEITVVPYNGSLLAANLLSSQQTLVLNGFGGDQTGALQDNDGTLSNLDDGVSTFNGQPVNYIGSGTVTPGVNVLGLTVPLGASVPVVVFEAGGQIYFHYPEGEPNLLGAVAVVIDINADGYDVFTPICFAAGTQILTDIGERPIEEIRAGDVVVDWFGQAHGVLWSGARTLSMPRNVDFDKWFPVRIRKNALTAGVPHQDTWVSQQHRLYLSGLEARLITGEEDCLASAKSLLNDATITLDRTIAEVSYHQLLCSRHVVLVANGMPAESLFLPQDDDVPDNLDLKREIVGLFPFLEAGMQLCTAEARGSEAAVIGALLQRNCA
jgi:hypothetical protein